MEIRTDPAKSNSLVVDNKTFRSITNYELSDKDLEKAEVELNETEEARNRCLRKLKEELSHDKVKYWTDDAYLIRFLRHKKFNWRAAYKSIRNFYSRRKEKQEVFCSLPPASYLETLLNVNHFCCLPYRDEEGSLIFTNKIARWNPSIYSAYNLLQFTQILADIMSMNPSVQIHGIVIIFDFKDVSMRLISAILDPRYLRFWLRAAQDLNPFRVKRLIFFNCNKLGLTTFGAVRYLLKKKIADRVTILGSEVCQLHEYLDPVILPVEYGGSLENWESCFTQHIMNNLPYLEYERSFFKT